MSRASEHLGPLRPESHGQRLPAVSAGGSLGKQAQEEEVPWARLWYKLTRKTGWFQSSSTFFLFCLKRKRGRSQAGRDCRGPGAPHTLPHCPKGRGEPPSAPQSLCLQDSGHLLPPSRHGGLVPQEGRRWGPEAVAPHCPCACFPASPATSRSGPPRPQGGAGAGRPACACPLCSQQPPLWRPPIPRA